MRLFSLPGIKSHGCGVWKTVFVGLLSPRNECTHPQLTHYVGDPPPTAHGGIRVEKLCWDDGMDWREGNELSWGRTAGWSFETDVDETDSLVWLLQSVRWCGKSAAMYRGRKEGWCRVLLEMGGRVGRLGLCREEKHGDMVAQKPGTPRRVCFSFR